MAEKNKKRLKLPVELDESGEFGIDPERLDASIHERINQIAEEKTPGSNHRLTISMVIGIFLMFLVALLFLRGLAILGVVLLVAAIFNVGNVVKWIESR